MDWTQFPSFRGQNFSNAPLMIIKSRINYPRKKIYANMLSLYQMQHLGYFSAKSEGFVHTNHIKPHCLETSTEQLLRE